MTYKMLKSSFIEEEQKFLNYKIYKTFSLENFTEDYSNALGSSSDSFNEVDHIFTTKLNKHATKKKKLIRGYSKSHINNHLPRLTLLMKQRITMILQELMILQL